MRDAVQEKVRQSPLPRRQIQFRRRLTNPATTSGSSGTTTTTVTIAATLGLSVSGLVTDALLTAVELKTADGGPFPPIPYADTVTRQPGHGGSESIA